MLFAPGLAYGFALVLVRTAGLVTAAPLFGLKNAPVQARIGLSFGLALVTYLAAGAGPVPLPPHLGALAVDVLLETLLGVFAGLAVHFVFEAAAIAGQLAAQTMGLGFGATLDASSGAESTALGQLFRLLALGAALGLGLHRELVTWLAASVQQVPPGSVDGLEGLARGAVVEAAHAMALGVRLGFPFLVAITLGHLALGLLGRAAQQLHFSNVGFSISILFGGGALWLATPLAVRLCAEASLRAVSHP
jgi:flagellar biosynthetic protein FliR